MFIVRIAKKKKLGNIIKAILKEHKKKNPKRYLLVSARARAKRQNIPFDLTENDFEIPEFCPCFGFKLVQNEKKSCPQSATLDQIIPGNGYVCGNVQVISLKANTMKSNASKDDLNKFVEWINKCTKSV